jgi:hypothetical protein
LTSLYSSSERTKISYELVPEQIIAVRPQEAASPYGAVQPLRHRDKFAIDSALPSRTTALRPTSSILKGSGLFSFRTRKYTQLIISIKQPRSLPNAKSKGRTNG